MSRRHARELALQVLFHVDVGHSDPDTALFQAFARELEEQDGDPLTEREAQFARDLVQGTWERKDEIDQVIASHAKDWSVDRMAGVDRNLLRMAIYELMHQGDIPQSVTIDEAVELAKSFSTADSSKFVNGILGSIARGLKQGGAPAEPTLSGS